MTKEEKIKEAYGRHWDEVWEFIDEDGFCEQMDYSKKPHLRRNHRTLQEMGFKEDDGLLDTGMSIKTGNPIWRPKTLRGIENNNNWIIVKDKKDLPEDDVLYFVIRQYSNSITVENLESINSNYHGYRVTHYQKLIKPQPPIY